MAFDLDRKVPKKGGRKPVQLKGTAADDPLADVEYTGSLEADCDAEFAAIDDAYRDRAKAEEKRFTKATDSEYWLAVCFADREEKERFLKAVGVKMNLLGDKYLTGRDLATALGIEF